MAKRTIGVWAAVCLLVVTGASVRAADPVKPAAPPAAKPAAAPAPAAPAVTKTAAIPATRPAAKATVDAKTVAPASGLRSSWACLPAGETVFAMRIPSGEQMLKTLRSDTKFGSVVLSEQRTQKFVELIKQESAGDWENMVKDMAKYGLKPEDWSSLFAGEAGMGVSITPVGGKEGEPSRKLQMMTLLWAEPSGDLGKRLYAAVQQGVADKQGKPDAPKRVDIELEGYQVMRITETEYRVAALPAIEPPADLDELSDAEQKAWWDKQNAEAKKAQGNRVLQGQTHALVALLGNRLVAGIAPPAMSPRSLGGEGSVDRPPTEVEMTQAAEQATGAFARFLAEHKKSGEQGGATGALMATPGAAAALPAGVPVVEMVADLRTLITHLQAQAPDPDAAKLMELSAIKQIGPMAMRVTLDKGAGRIGMFASIPAPRAGLLTLMDQPALPFEPAAFAPADAIGYQHISFDLGKAYLRIKELAIAGFGQQAEQGFMSAEQSAMGMLQVELPVVLSSLGQQHTIVTYAPAVQAAAAPAPAMGAAPAGGTVTTRTALVWMIKDNDLWKRILQAAGMMAGGGGPLMWAEEQGFSGWRMKQPGPGGGAEGGLFVGKNFLTLNIGPQVTETTLNTLSKQPEGKASMRGSDLFQRAKALLGLKPSQIFHINDVNHSMPLMREMFIAALEQAASGGPGFDMGGMDGGDAEDEGMEEERGSHDMHVAPRPMQDDDGHAHDSGNGAHGHAHGHHGKRMPVEKIKAILPTEKELDGVLGASVGQVIVSPQGVTYQSAIEMPPAK